MPPRRLFEFEVPKRDGGFLRTTLARPKTWIDDQLHNESDAVFLEFEELGIAHWGQLLATHPCPEPGPGNGRLVTGTFYHSAANVIDLHVEGLEEPINTAPSEIAF